MEFQEKRRLLYGKGQEAARAAAGAALLGAGRLADALEYLERTKGAEPLAEVRRAAVRAGDFFSLVRACQILKAEPDAGEFRELAAEAERRERFYDAVNALERAGEAEKAEALRQARCPDFRPFRPAGK